MWNGFHGLPDTPPAVLGAPVGLEDLAPSILRWAGAAVPEALRGEPLPTRSSEPPAAPRVPRDLLAVWSDARPVTPAGLRPVIVYDNRQINQKRVGCAGSDRVFGDMAGLMRFPHRMLWFEAGPPELYDLERDPGETQDIAAGRPDLLAELAPTVEAFRSRLEALPARQAGYEVSPEALEAIRRLGYVH